MKPSSSPKRQDIIKILKDMDSLQASYPDELLSARRASFMDRVAQLNPTEAEEPSPVQQKTIIDLLKALKLLRGEYPSELFAARRAAFISRIRWAKWLSPWITLRLALKERVPSLTGTSGALSMELMRTSLIVAGLVLAAFMGFWVSKDRTPSMSLAPSGDGRGDAILVMISTNTPEPEIICKPGYLPPLCLAAEFKNDNDLTLPKNGTARPAVAKDTLPGFGGVHRASYVNDGKYGPGASWVSNSENSWVKIDLGKKTPVNAVAFGRDRLGELNDRDPGQFVVAVALSDDVYANGVSTNDEMEYTDVYDSEQAGFTGDISGAETVTAQFQTRQARFVKITFEKKGAAIDEVEVFMLQSPLALNGAGEPTKEKRSGSLSSPPLPTYTLVPTLTLVPSRTPTLLPTSTPPATFTPVPTKTATPLPSNTPIPTDTATSPPTNTPVPTDTPVPTNTPVPTDTSIPAPTDTAVPSPSPVYIHTTETPILPTP